MLNRLAELFTRTRPEAAAAPGRDRLALGVAALLVEAGDSAGGFSAEERAAAEAALARRFGLEGKAAAALLEEAIAAQARSVQLYGFTRAINDAVPPDEKAGIIEMLWEIALADGTLDPHENSLIRRIAGLIHVSDRARGEARQRVLARLGRTD